MTDSTKVGIGVAVLVISLVAWHFAAYGAGDVFVKAATAAKAEDTAPADETPKAQTPAEVLEGQPREVGPADAPVTIKVLLGMTNTCHTDSVAVFRGLADEYKGQVRVIFADMADPEIAKAAEAAKIGCEMGILINGRSVFRIPGRGLVMFQGPTQMAHDYSLDDLHLVVDDLIRKKTGKDPLRTAHQTAPAASATPSS